MTEEIILTHEERQDEQIDYGIKLIGKLLKAVKKPASDKSKKEIAEGHKILKNKQKMMKKDESLKSQYSDRVAFETIQGVFQALHLYIISTEGSELIDDSVSYLRTFENCYDIAERMEKAAIKKAEFNGGK